MVEWKLFYERYYADNRPLYDLLLTHSSHVARKALAVADAHGDLQLDRDFLYEASMLHDIGIFRTDAPSIFCHGDQPYICHGIIGAGILRAEGLEYHARVCERHTGAGITREDVEKQGLPLPSADYVPRTLEEKLVCFADKFFSKTRPEVEKTIEQAKISLQKFGPGGVTRFGFWCDLFLRPYTIRRAVPTDVDVLSRLLRQVLAVHHTIRPDLFLPEGKKYSDAELLVILSDDSRPVFVYEEQGVVQGYVFCAEQRHGSGSEPEYSTLYIDDLCVEESARGKHVGMVLYEYARHYAVCNGYHNITLHVWEGNDQARVFYDHIGLKTQYTSLEDVLSC